MKARLTRARAALTPVRVSWTVTTAGVASVAYGAGLVFEPAGFIVAGLCAVAGGVFLLPTTPDA